MRNFEGAICLITGAASGIGAATATLLADQGAKKLILVDLDEEKLADFAFSLPCERQPIVGDVNDQRLGRDAEHSAPPAHTSNFITFSHSRYRVPINEHMRSARRAPRQR